MNKLGALDAGFLYNETVQSPQHIASVQVLDLPEAVTETEFLANVKALLLERIHLVPYFTSKLKFVPFNLDHPVWVRDRSFNIDNHVHIFAAEAPGGRAELEDAVARLHEMPLDRNRPLWDLWLITGLEGGRVAYYNRAHHACVDGVAGQAMIEMIMDLTPLPRVVEPPTREFLERPDYASPMAMLSGALENFARYQAKQPLAFLNGLETASRLFQRSFDPSKGLGAVAEQAPRTRFNRTVSAERRYATGELPLDSVKTIAKVTQTKVNDVFLAVCAGGLRRYLDRHGELPGTSLIAGCPVSLRRPGDTGANNQVTMMMVSLATNESDPGERLQTIAQSSRTAKGFTEDIAGSYDTDVSLPGMPATMSAGVRLAEMLRMPDLPGVRVPFNVVISNVPGPQQALYSCGARVLTHYPVSIPAHTQAVNITVQSYAGVLYFGITACARALPDWALLRDDLLSAFEELRARYELPSVSVAMQQKAAAAAANAAPTPRRKADAEETKAA